MGEIGISRKEFLYDIRFWEVRRIILGYRKRGRLTNQLLAETVYATIHVMRDPKGKTASDLFPDIFEDEDIDDTSPISEEDAAELQELMSNINHQGETQQ